MNRANTIALVASLLVTSQRHTTHTVSDSSTVRSRRKLISKPSLIELFESLFEALISHSYTSSWR
jgi:hypothetical protein